ncbi:MAG: nicotinate-nucleotide adenylyltransferase [Clostridia bacterium]|nr:nicotinate-nucleotide adenylyltransferase [Clostridia bacterium]
MSQNEEMTQEQEQEQERTLRVGLYGGTFSPVHNGHVQAVKAFMKQMWLDYVFVMPARIPPHKEARNLPPAAERLKMCELAFSGMEGVLVSDLEVRREGPSYTVDTLRALTAPDTRLFLLCGTDMVLTLDSWYRADEIFRLSYPVYVRRENDPVLEERIKGKLAEYMEKYHKMVRRIVVDPIEVSSTQIRDMVRRGEDISPYVPAAVCRYIKEKGLYRDGQEE